MMLKRLRYIGLLIAVLCVGVFALPVMPQASKTSLMSLSADTKIVGVTLGKAELVALPYGVADVLVADPSKVDVMAVQADQLYIVGLEVGDTNIMALDADGNMLKRLDIHVKYDLVAIQDLVNELFPGEDIKIASVHDQILVTGTASTPEKASKIMNLIGHYVSDLQDESKSVDELISNLLDVRGEQQVMLQVRIIEASRSMLKELGVETNFNDPDELATTTLFGQTRPANVGADGDAAKIFTGAGVALSQEAVGSGQFFIDSGLPGIGTIGLFLNALEDENLVNILAEPNLTAVSGEQAGFLAGGEFPVPVGRDNVGNVVFEFKQFGVSLNFRPKVLGPERISLQLDTEVSSLDTENSVTIADLTVPGLDVRRAETTVEIPSGGSLMIAGLLQSEAVKGMAGLPGIKNAPVLGDLMSSDSFKRSETELVLIVSPYLVKPYEETARAEIIPEAKANPLARSFQANLRERFDIKDEDIFSGNEGYGYILD
jgi:pilus assembly protein CpaC